MMDTVLNVGLNDGTLRGLIRQTGNARLAWDCYRRLVEAFAEIVHGTDTAPFETAIRRAVSAQEVDSVRELDSAGLEELTQEFLRIFSTQTGTKFPQDPVEQLVALAEAVFRSWQSPRAVQYRRMNRLESLAGTAVTVQTMVFGNGGLMSGSGVGFTRDPALGGKELYVDFLPNAQGEDVVSGRQAILHPDQLQRLFPAVYRELQQIRVALEKEFGDVQEFEFTVQDGRLYMLQTRRAKRTGWAALRHAVDMVEEGVIAPAAALQLLAECDVRGLVRDRLAPRPGEAAICRASPASFGIAVGPVAFDPQRAQAMADSGKPVILVRHDLATADLDGIAAAAGIVTARGARTSHAAVVARELNKVCLVGCPDLAIDAASCKARLAGYELAEGDVLSLDGESGAIYLGEIPVVRERPVDLLRRVESWRVPVREAAAQSV
jgi:pyruvate,orthophosphate dikinase